MLLFLNISGGEILVILVVIYLVFGPKKIPELARMLGKGINEMRRATNDIKNEITREINNAKKDANLDIDLGDPLGIKKTVEDTFNDNPRKPQTSPKQQPSEANKATAPPVEHDNFSPNTKKTAEVKDSPNEETKN